MSIRVCSKSQSPVKTRSLVKLQTMEIKPEHNKTNNKQSYTSELTISEFVYKV